MKMPQSAQELPLAISPAPAQPGHCAGWWLKLMMLMMDVTSLTIGTGFDARKESAPFTRSRTSWCYDLVREVPRSSAPRRKRSVGRYHQRLALALGLQCFAMTVCPSRCGEKSCFIIVLCSWASCTELVSDQPWCWQRAGWEAVQLLISIYSFALRCELRSLDGADKLQLLINERVVYTFCCA